MKKRGFHMAVLLGFVTMIGSFDGLADFFDHRIPPIEQRADRGKDHTGTLGDTCPACIHEASHAVVAMVMGGCIKFIRLTSDGSGKTSFIGPVGQRANAIIALAGCVGERVLARDTCDGTERDIKVARSKVGKNYMALMPEVEKIVKEHRAAILRIASELKEKRFLTGRRVRQLLPPAFRCEKSTFDEINRHER
jgi:Peptidase M50B-like